MGWRTELTSVVGYRLVQCNSLKFDMGQHISGQIALPPCSYVFELSMKLSASWVLLDCYRPRVKPVLFYLSRLVWQVTNIFWQEEGSLNSIRSVNHQSAEHVSQLHSNLKRLSVGAPPHISGAQETMCGSLLPEGIQVPSTWHRGWQTCEHTFLYARTAVLSAWLRKQILGEPH